MRRLLTILGLLTLSGAALPVLSQTDDPPRRVVSMNLCTDQLAMMLASPGQLYSVSGLAADPRGSAMAEQAQSLVLNHGLAEEIYLMDPDLVIAGSFSARATVDMLKRLGIPVIVLDPAYSLDDIRDRITTMGDVLHQQDEAARLIADFDRDLAALADEVTIRPRAALYAANGYTQGERSLSGQILVAAGFDNIADELGLPFGGTLPMEVLAMSDPDALILGSRYPGASRAEAVLDHPVIAMLRDGRYEAMMTDRDWVCGTPHVLRAIAALADDRRRMEAAR